MLARWLLRFALVLPATVGAVLLASSGGGLPFEARIAAGALTFSAVVIARDTRSAMVRAAVCLAASALLALAFNARG